MVESESGLGGRLEPEKRNRRHAETVFDFRPFRTSVFDRHRALRRIAGDLRLINKAGNLDPASANIGDSGESAAPAGVVIRRRRQRGCRQARQKQQKKQGGQDFFSMSVSS